MNKKVILKLIEQPTIPVEAESITPENLNNKSIEEIRQLPLWCGNCQKKIGDYFEVSIYSDIDRYSAVSDFNRLYSKIILNGDFSKFKRLGQGMTFGEMIIEGSVGFHAGAYMSGGSLLIKGNAADWLGAHMQGGQITVEGSAGHFIGSAYRGKSQGMNGGVILVKGNVGQMAGARMRRGIIAVGGDCGDALGFKMLAGTILVAGPAGLRAGANMRRGTIIFFKQPELLPTFYFNCVYHPVFWKLLCQELQSKGFSIPKIYWNSGFKLYSGDILEGGKGEILICQLV